MQRTTVLLLFGGESSEHDVSLSSARNVFAAIDDTKYEIILTYIDRQGVWWNWKSFDDRNSSEQLQPVLGDGYFTTSSGASIRPDVLLPILHGKNGEDGSVQALAQLLHIPIVGCDMTASSICMDKLATKRLLESCGMNTAPYRAHYAYEPNPNFNQLSLQLGSPMFVKPARAGSSVGVSKVYSDDDLVAALALAHQHDETVLIERGIDGRELEVAVLGNPPDHQASGVGEIKPGDSFYSYDAKYAQDSTSEAIVSADLPEDTAQVIREQAKRAYQVLGCKGLARVDFFLSKDGTVYINEINTMPGFTNISMYPKLWNAEGMTYSQLIDTLINLAINDTIKEK